MSEEQKIATDVPVRLDEPARSAEATEWTQSVAAPLAPAPSLRMIAGDGAGLCTGDTCAVPLPSLRKEK
jgi:hypothetical protein